MIPVEVLAQLPSLGVAGLLFVMWWYERQERGREGATRTAAQESATRAAEINAHILEVVRANTEALTALREALRAHRTTEAEWFAQLSRQLDELAE